MPEAPVTMNLITLIVAVLALFLAFKLYDLCFGRFGLKSRFKLWRKFKNDHVTIYVVEPRNWIEARGKISPATFYPRLKLAFATEADMTHLAELDLPSGIDISSQIKSDEVMSLHFHGRKLCQIERRKGSVFLRGELYALVDAQRSNTKAIRNGGMVAAA